MLLLSSNNMIDYLFVCWCWCCCCCCFRVFNVVIHTNFCLAHFSRLNSILIGTVRVYDTSIMQTMNAPVVSNLNIKLFVYIEIFLVLVILATIYLSYCIYYYFLLFDVIFFLLWFVSITFCFFKSAIYCQIAVTYNTKQTPSGTSKNDSCLAFFARFFLLLEITSDS